MSSDIVFPLTAKNFGEHCVLCECGISHLCVIVTNTQDSQNVNKKVCLGSRETSIVGWPYCCGAALSMCGIELVTLRSGRKNNKEERICPPVSPEDKAPVT